MVCEYQSDGIIKIDHHSVNKEWVTRPEKALALVENSGDMICFLGGFLAFVAIVVISFGTSGCVFQMELPSGYLT